MKNYQHTLRNNTLHLMLSAEIISDFYPFSAKTENTNRRRIIDTLIGTPGVPIIYRTIKALKAGLGDLHKTTNITDVVALSGQPGRYNTDNTLVTFHGVVYNEELICDKFHRDCLVVPLIGVFHRDKQFQVVDRTEVAIGDALDGSYIDNDRRQYYLRALLVVDMGSVGLSHILDMEDGGDKYRALIKHIVTDVKEDRGEIKYEQRSGAGVFTLNDELMSLDDTVKYSAQCDAARRLWQDEHNNL